MTGIAFFDITACMFKLVKSILSPENNPVELYHNGINEGKTILIIGGFHGDEPQAPEILAEFVKNDFPSKNSVYIIPCLNPDGLKSKKRVNSNGVDLNRNFPAKNWEKSEHNEFFGGDFPASEPETKFLCDIIEKLSEKGLELILSIHAPFKVVNFDGPALAYAEKISEFMQYPVQNDIGYSTPGSFGTYCGVERNIPTITLELGEDEEMPSLKNRCYRVFGWLSSVE